MQPGYSAISDQWQELPKAQSWEECVQTAVSSYPAAKGVSWFENEHYCSVELGQAQLMADRLGNGCLIPPGKGG